MTRPARGLDPEAIRWDDRGLVPVVVQDTADGRLLMLAHADREALEATLASGEVHFHSRSRGRLWRKGETSGNVLRLVDLALDCDGDAILATVEPTGPTCHTGARSCFDEAPGAALPQGFAWLERLWSTIDERRTVRPAGSYTTSLLEGGVDATARKVAEEATEVVLAAKDDAAAARATRAATTANSDRQATRAALAGEAADLVYHLLVLLAERDLPPTEVLAVLRGRMSSTSPERSRVAAPEPTRPPD